MGTYAASRVIARKGNGKNSALISVLKKYVTKKRARAASARKTELTNLFNSNNSVSGIQIGNKTHLFVSDNTGGAKIFNSMSETEVKNLFKEITGVGNLTKAINTNGGMIYVVKTPSGNINLRNISSSSKQSGAKWTIDLPKGYVNANRNEIKFR